MAKRRIKRRGPIRLPLLILLDVLMIGAALLVFALFHHVIPQQQTSLGIISARPGAQTVQKLPSETVALAAPTAEATAAPVPTDTPLPAESTEPEPTAEPTPEPTPEATEEIILDATLEPTPTPEPVGYFGNKFRTKFCEAGGALQGNNFQGVNANVTLSRKKVNGSYVCYADIYIRDISNLVSVLANDTFGKGITEWVPHMSKRKGGIVAISGDYYGGHADGIVIRNGTVYRSTNSSGADVCVLYWDGVMETYSASEFDLKTVLERGVYQAWCFGPSLLTADGKSISKFNSTIERENPRAVIGYFEPGHYCFVLVEGRTKYSQGMTLKELSKLMETLGCVSAYNLDGGATATLVAGSERYNEQGDHARPSTDAIMIIN